MTEQPTIGEWNPGETPPAFEPAQMSALIHRVRQPLYIVQEGLSGRVGLGLDGEVSLASISPTVIGCSVPFRRFTRSGWGIGRFRSRTEHAFPM